MKEERLRRKLARALKRERNLAELSLTQAAARITKLGLECSRERLMTWERLTPGTNRADPPAWAMPIIALAYGCHVGAFFDEPKRKK